MKRDCSTCICKEGSCYPSTTIFDKDKTCKSYSPDYEGYIAELEKENAELKDGIALKDEEVGCIETDFNTFKSKAKEIIKYLCGMVRELNKPNVQLTNIDYSLSEAEQFIKYSEVEK